MESFALKLNDKWQKKRMTKVYGVNISQYFYLGNFSHWLILEFMKHVKLLFFYYN